MSGNNRGKMGDKKTKASQRKPSKAAKRESAFRLAAFNRGANVAPF